jgi:hypothetical protein
MNESVQEYITRLSTSIVEPREIASYASRKFEIEIGADYVARVLSGGLAVALAGVKGNEAQVRHFAARSEIIETGGDDPLLKGLAKYHLAHSNLQPHERAYYQAVAQ